jgi:endonuclease/exonuclease/phosphatase family metal-dependent hydrolase
LAVDRSMTAVRRDASRRLDPASGVAYDGGMRSRTKWVLLTAATVALAALVYVFWGSWREWAPGAVPPAPAAEGDIEIRVMSFNILSSAKWERHVGPWEERRESVAACVRDFGPDSLGMQEVMASQAGDLSRLLPGYDSVGAGRLDGKQEGAQTAVFFRCDLFEKLDEGHFWLSETPDEPGSRDWLSAVPRTVSWVRLRYRSRPDVVLYHFNTHLDPLSGYARVRAATLLRERIEAIAGSVPVILTGDFNTDAGKTTYRTLLGEEDAALRLIDSYRSVHSDPVGNEGTYHLPGGVRLRRRIDWILHTRHFRAVEAGIETGKFLGRWPSDHCAVTAVLVLTAENIKQAE